MNRSLLLPAAAALLFAQQPSDTLYDETKVPQYSLPGLLVMKDGGRVSDSKMWTAKRRPEILEMYRTQVFGRAPAKSPQLAFHVDSVDKKALDGRAVRKLVTITFAGGDTPKAHLQIYLPATAKKPVPLFLALGFAPNASVSADPGAPLGEQWIRDPNTKEFQKRPTPEQVRGSSAQRWQLDQILAHGYGLATIYYYELEPDFAGGMKYGIRPHFFKAGQTEPAPDEWGAISAWAWGLSRAMDYIETDKDIDSKRVGVMGHSRLGKTALWAVADDPRFTFAISNESGEGGAAISRRDFGERTKDLNRSFPHWFCGNFKKYDDREDQMPFDSHFLLALAAPRGVYVASAEEDRWSDPRGEFLGAVNAGPAWELFGKKGIGTDAFPALHQPVGNTVMYHIRAGKHDVIGYDWEQYLKFAEKQWTK